MAVCHSGGEYRKSTSSDTTVATPPAKNATTGTALMDKRKRFMALL